MNFSRQRESILNYLMNSTEHPTAERIYSDLKSHLPNLSLATVYRNLAKLCETGRVIKLTTGDKTDHYDADISEHQHFVCSCCDTVSDLFFKIPAKLFDENLEDGYSCDSYKLYIYGECPKCKSKKKCN